MIGAIEDAIIARLKLRFRGRLKAIDHRPVKLDAEELQRILTTAPGAYVAFLGFQPGRQDGVRIATYGIYLIAANAAGEVARRRGAAGEIGAYDMVVVASRAMERFKPADAAGAIEVRSAEVLSSAVFEKFGRTVFGLVLDAPIEISARSGWSGGAPIDHEDDPEAQLREFTVLHTDWDIPPLAVGTAGAAADVALPLPATAPDAADHITLKEA